MIVEAMKGYRAADLPKDAVAGLVIAALSVPIAMGYAEVVGLPAIYGLWASIVAPLAFGLLTGTRRVVFGMDSAAARHDRLDARCRRHRRPGRHRRRHAPAHASHGAVPSAAWLGGGGATHPPPAAAGHARVHIRHRDHGGHRPDPAASGARRPTPPVPLCRRSPPLSRACRRLVGLRGGGRPCASPACTS